MNNQLQVLNRIKTLSRLVEKHGRKCFYCGTKFSSFKEVELEHIVPKSRGGENKIANYAIACLICNDAKNNRSLDDFLRWLHKPKVTLPYLKDRAKESEQHWRDWGTEIEKGLRKPSTAKGKYSKRLIAYEVRVVDEVQPVEPSLGPEEVSEGF